MNKKDLFLKMLGITPHILLIGVGGVSIKLGMQNKKMRKELIKKNAELVLTDILLINQLDKVEKCEKNISKLKADIKVLEANQKVKKK